MLEYLLATLQFKAKLIVFSEIGKVRGVKPSILLKTLSIITERSSREKTGSVLILKLRSRNNISIMYS
jgi:hypothetical protein